MSSHSSSPPPSIYPATTELSLANTELTPLPIYKPPGTIHLDFEGLLSPPLHLHEDLGSGCGGQSWPAGMLLARYLLRHHWDELGGWKILELGAGGGLVGLAVALASQCRDGTDPVTRTGTEKENSITQNRPRKIQITDQEEMMSLMKKNITLNSLEPLVETMILNWGSPLPLTITESPPTHILAADCVYFEPAFPLLLATLGMLLGLNPEAMVFFCFKKRRRADMQFMKKARKMFVVEEVEDEERKSWERERLWLYVFRSKCLNVSHVIAREKMINIS